MLFPRFETIISGSVGGTAFSAFDCCGTPLTLPGNLPAENRQVCQFGDRSFIDLFPDRITNIVSIYFFPFAALNLTRRTSTPAFDIKIKIKIQQGEFAEALKLVTEWRLIDPEVRENLN